MADGGQVQGECVRVTVEGRTDRIDQFFRAIADHDLVVVQSRRHLRFGAISSETFTVSGSSMGAVRTAVYRVHAAMRDIEVVVAEDTAPRRGAGRSGARRRIFSAVDLWRRLVLGRRTFSTVDLWRRPVLGRRIFSAVDPRKRRVLGEGRSREGRLAERLRAGGRVQLRRSAAAHAGSPDPTKPECSPRTTPSRWRATRANSSGRAAQSTRIDSTISTSPNNA